MTTELITTKTLIAWAAVPLITFAVLDASAQTGIINLISLAITSITAIIVALIGLKVRKLEKNTNGMNEKLQSAIAGESLAIGREEGIAQAETKAAVIATAKAEGVAQEKALK